jgi:HEAT repeat protein
MREVEDIIEEVVLVKDSFKPIRDLADDALARHSEEEALALAHALYRSEVHQARMLATILLGRLSVARPEAFDFLHDVVSQDLDWRTQEMLAMAFDTYCKGIGYEQALPTIERWLGDPNHNVRRAVSEGLRIWTRRPFFKQHPERAVALLGRLKADEHPYVRKSAGNALRDVSRFHKALVAAEVGAWDLGDARVADTYTYAAKFLK